MAGTKRAEQIIKLLNTHQFNFSTVVTKLAEKDIPVLNAFVGHADINIARRAILCLGSIGSIKSLEGIESAAGNSNPVLRLTAAQALGEIKDVNKNPLAIRIIKKLLGDGDIGVKKYALRTTLSLGLSEVKAEVQNIKAEEQNAQIKELASQVLQQLEIANTTKNE